MGKETILIIDDEIEILKLLVKRIESENYKVDCYDSGDGAYEKICEVNPDLVLLDLQLPVVSGIEIYKKIQNNKKFESMPVLFLTANSDKEKQNEIINIGVPAGFINKPFDGKELLNIIRSILEDSC